MRYDIKKRNKFGKIIYSWPILILLAALIILAGKNVFEVYKNEHTSRLNREKSEKVLMSLEERNDFIVSGIETLRTEKGIEAEIRNKFRVVKEGEQLAIIINSDKDKKKVIGDVEKEKIWTKIWNFFK
ncbi:MAG: hypothetical protein KAV41_02655 [Candidatus Pacebacteria bacterium]|nr:hypothetical protein [Candidatus Paceibacterota bacterium]